jgi:hypothetical protein
MYFNRRVLFASAVITCQSVVKAGDCKQSFVQSASDAGFLKYALLNCIAEETAANTVNALGEDVIDPQSCLTTFEESTGVAFSKEAPACVDTYRSFVADLAGMISGGDRSPFDAVAGLGADNEGCQYDAESDEILMSYVCWNRMSTYLTAFQQSAGYPIFIQPCEAAFVRSVTLDDAIQTAITNTLDASTPSNFAVKDWRDSLVVTNGQDHIVVGDWEKDIGGYYKRNDVDLKTGMCYGAYQTLLDLLQGSGAIVITTPPLGVDSFGAFNTGPAGWGLSTLEEACKEDMTSASCANSQLITSLKSLFLSLSGYDITFAGPLCTANQITSLNSGLEPTPFQLFLKCGLMASDYPAECSVPSLAQYNTQLVATVGEECSSCFTEMLAEVALLASNETVMAVCDSPANFSSSACVVAMKDVAENYKNCTGFDLKTGELIEEVTTSSTSTTTSPTDANDATRIIMSSGVIVMVAVMTYLL